MIYDIYSGWHPDYQAGNSNATGEGYGSCYSAGAGSYNDKGNGSGKGDGSGDWCTLSPILVSGTGSGCHINYIDTTDSGYAGGADTGWFDPST